MPELRRVDEVTWEVPASAAPHMRVPARVFGDREVIEAVQADGSLAQLQNVAALPGAYGAALAMPDVHQGYGFPVGGVAATETPDGVVSPGGVGYDINCGVRLLATPLGTEEIGDRLESLVHEISRAVPPGGGRGGGGGLSLSRRDFRRVLTDGPRALVDAAGVGTAHDVEHTESRGRLEGAEPRALSARAGERGSDQLGTMGSGNHFVEVQRVERLLEPAAAGTYGLEENGITILIHSGSRGLGHQVCTDYVKRMDAAIARYRIELPDRQLACAPLSSPEGREYMAAMACAANFAWANRQAIAHRVREAIARVLGREQAEGTRQVYDVAHNVAKVERHDGRSVCVHRKGATRAFPPGSDEIPAAHREAGQAVFIPGSMGTSSFVLAGAPGAMERSFGTVCHGAGRRMSRRGARREVRGGDLRRQLEEQGIVIRCPSNKGLAEEAPTAYKDVEQVVAIVEQAGLARRVAQLRPIGVVKG